MPKSKFITVVLLLFIFVSKLFKESIIRDLDLRNKIGIDNEFKTFTFIDYKSILSISIILIVFVSSLLILRINKLDKSLYFSFMLLNAILLSSLVLLQILQVGEIAEIAKQKIKYILESPILVFLFLLLFKFFENKKSSIS